MTIPITQGDTTFAGFTTLCVILVFGIILVITFSRVIRCARIGLPIALGLILSSFLLLITVIMNNSLTRDQITWHSLGWASSQYLTGASSQSVQYVTGKEGYVWIVGSMYAVAGAVPLVPILVNMILHMLLIVSVARTTELVSTSFTNVQHGGRSAVMFAAYATAMLPSVVWWVPSLLRETLTWLIVSLSTLCVIQFKLAGKSRNLIWASLLLLCLYWVRGSTGAAVALALILASVYVRLGGSRYVAILRGTLILAMVGLFPTVWRFFDSLNGLTVIDISAGAAELSQIATSGFPGITRASGLTSILTTTAPRVLFGPFPWEFRPSGVMLLAFMEGTIWLVILALALRTLHVGHRLSPQGDRRIDDRRLTPFLVIVATFILMGLVVTVGNYGMLARFRPIALFVLLPLAAISVGNWVDSRSKASDRPNKPQQNTPISPHYRGAQT